MFIIDTDTQHGLQYVETSRHWKEICSTLPCSAQQWWPDYLTKVVRVRIDNEPVIIQLWKGWCQRFLGRYGNCPGGMGAEVGIYRTVSDGQSTDRPTLFRKSGKRVDGAAYRIRKRMSRAAHRASRLNRLVSHVPRNDPAAGSPDGEVWYPYPELGTRLWFELVNPVTGQRFFETSTERTYWLTRWMTPDSYRKKYQREHRTPLFAASYRLHYTINGVAYPAW